jgi:hypothetical protein
MPNLDAGDTLVGLITNLGQLLDWIGRHLTKAPSTPPSRATLSERLAVAVGRATSEGIPIIFCSVLVLLTGTILLRHALAKQAAFDQKISDALSAVVAGEHEPRTERQIGAIALLLGNVNSDLSASEPALWEDPQTTANAQALIEVLRGLFKSCQLPQEGRT